nr:pilus assembly protein PilM [Pseudomonas fragi]
MIVLAGEAAVVPGLAQRVESRLGTPTRIANPFVQMDQAPALTPEALLCDAPLLLTACGLALRGFD